MGKHFYLEILVAWKSSAISSAPEQWLFCVLFSFILNVTAIAAWGPMQASGKIAPAVAFLASAYLLLSLLLSLYALHLERSGQITSMLEDLLEVTMSEPASPMRGKDKSR